MASETTPGRLGRLRRVLAREWREIGGLGRIALVGVVAAAALAIGLGFSITAAARGHLLDSRAEILAGITADLEQRYGLPSDGSEAAAFDAAVRERLVGGETVRVKVWSPEGRVVYSDDVSLIGEHFDLSDAAQAAFDGERSTAVSDLTEPAHAPHRHLGSLIEFYLPYTSEEGQVTSVFEVEQRTDLLGEALGRIERNVWLSIGAGLAVLGIFLGALIFARARDLNRRRRQAENVLGASLRLQEEERHRIIGSLHDDVGQPLYRLLYGLEGTAARLPNGDPLRAELESLAESVHDIDRILRAELRMLHKGLLADLGLGTALAALAETVEAETDLRVEVSVDLDFEPGDLARQAVFRAASEAVTNVRRHADASSVCIEVTTHRGLVELTVTDDGAGGEIVPGLGLTTHRERLETLGGSLRVTSRPGSGTTFEASVPMTVEES